METNTASVNKLANPGMTHEVKAKEVASQESNAKAIASKVTSSETVQKALHAKPGTLPNKYIFKKVQSGDNGLTVQAKKILDRFQINENATKYDSAVLSDDGNTLVIASRGDVGLKQLFGGLNGFTRTMYKIFGCFSRLLGAPDKAIAANRYKELFNGPDIEEQGEPLKHVLTALKASEYHTVTVFHKDEKTGDFAKNPAAVSIIDAFANLIETHIRQRMRQKNLPESEIESEIKAKKEKYGTFEKYYSGDKLIPLSKSSDDLKDIMHQIVEGLYAAQSFDAFLIPSQVHPETNMNSNDLNYAEIDWHYIKQKADGKWTVVGDPKLLDSAEFSDPQEKESYLAKMTQTKYSPKLTIVRPIDKAQDELSPFLADLQQWSTMSQGSQLRTSNAEDLKLVEMSEPVNALSIKKLNDQKVKA